VYRRRTDPQRIARASLRLDLAGEDTNRFVLAPHARDFAWRLGHASGLRFTSRLPPAWECWALWEPLPLDEPVAQAEDVTFLTPALRTAADMLGVALAT
jgi:hypothetical protein